jgi:hypothetical protein
LEGMGISAVQNTKIEGRHSDQSCRHTTEHCPSISPVRLERLNASRLKLRLTELSYRFRSGRSRIATVVPSITTGPEPRSYIQSEHLTGALLKPPDSLSK